MIYFIDEDLNQLKPYVLELQIRRMTVRQIDNPDEAYSVLSAAKKMDLAIIDIMMSVGDVAHTRFDRNRTRDFIRTGLALLEDLILVRGDLFPKRSVIFSMASQDWLIQEIERACLSHGIQFLRKKDFGSPFAFGAKIEEILQQMR